MSRHRDPSSDDDLPVTISDDTWTRVTGTEEWETTPAALSAGNSRWNGNAT